MQARGFSSLRVLCYIHGDGTTAIAGRAAAPHADTRGGIHLLLVFEDLDLAINLVHREQSKLRFQSLREILRAYPTRIAAGGDNSRRVMRSIGALQRSHLLLLLQVIGSRDLVVDIALLLLQQARLGFDLVEVVLGERNLCTHVYNALQ
mgnify:CR=1 FL=1